MQSSSLMCCSIMVASTFSPVSVTCARSRGGYSSTAAGWSSAGQGAVKGPHQWLRTGVPLRSIEDSDLQCLTCSSNGSPTARQSRSSRLFRRGRRSATPIIESTEILWQSSAWKLRKQGRGPSSAHPSSRTLHSFCRRIPLNFLGISTAERVKASSPSR